MKNHANHKKEAGATARCLNCGELYTKQNENNKFCDRDCSEAHEAADWIYSDNNTFRERREHEICKNRHGRDVEMVLCEELIEARWEPFYSVVR